MSPKWTKHGKGQQFPCFVLTIKHNTMYKFFKVFPNGKEKYCDTFRSTLDPNYHAYINWCNENGIGWKLVGSDGKIKFQSAQ